MSMSVGHSIMSDSVDPTDCVACQILFVHGILQVAKSSGVGSYSLLLQGIFQNPVSCVTGDLLSEQERGQIV